MKRDLVVALALCALVGVPVYLLEKANTINFGKDWNDSFYPGTSLLLHGLNPYQVKTLHNPVWALFPLVPMALLGLDLGRTALFFANLFSFTFIALRLKAKPAALTMLLLSPLVLFSLYLGNIDWLVIWGFLMPPAIGLFFLAVKPQIAIAVAIYWAYLAWQEGGLRKLAVLFLPVAVTLAATFLLFGNWVADKTDRLVAGATWNMSLFPWSLPVGVLLLVTSLLSRRIRLSIAASPFLSPYLGLGSWSILMLGVLDRNLTMFGVFAGTWILFIGNALLNLQR